MAQKFNQRFNIDVDLHEARRRFVNRLHYVIFYKYVYDLYPSDRWFIMREVLGNLGEKHGDYETPLNDHIGDDFYRNLEALEVFSNTITRMREEEISSRQYRPDSEIDPDAIKEAYRKFPNLEELIESLLSDSEVDLEIRWKAGHFIRSGATELDERLVNEPLEWLSGGKFEPVRTPFEKGLRHFLYSPRRPEVLSDVITDMYEALEALAKIVTNRLDKDLSANQEFFIRQVKASIEYKQLLKDYITYANRFRHALKEGSPKPDLSPKEAESFIYLTGLFIRLAMP